MHFANPTTALFLKYQHVFLFSGIEITMKDWQKGDIEIDDKFWRLNIQVWIENLPCINEATGLEMVKFW